MIGDVIGKPGRHALKSTAPALRDEYAIDLIIANGENAAGGIGLTADTADEIFASGVDVITSGNHIWAHKDLLPVLEGNAAVLRPLNYPPGVAGSGYTIVKGVLVISLLGRTFIGNVDCPFRAVDSLLERLGDDRPAVTVVDFHAEATSEKVAMGWYLNGRVSGVTGTHTHVGTVDARVLPDGTAFICDIGIVGPTDSVIGDNIESVIKRFLTQLPHRISVGSGKTIFNSVLIDVDEATGKATSIQRINREVN